MSRVELGVQLRARTMASLVEQAGQAERAGLDAVTVADHLAAEALPPLPACTLLAQTTERLRFGTLVLNNDFRHPAVLAREAAAIAELAPGRFELGLGAGHMRAEYARAGLRFDPGSVRIARLAESVTVLRRLLSGEEVTFAGDHYALVGERSFPVPSQPVRLVVGGNAPAIRRLAAERADVLGLTGFSFRRGGTAYDTSGFTCAGLTDQLADVPAAAELHALVQWIELTTRRSESVERAAAFLELPLDVVDDSPYVLIGTAREMAARLEELRERFGITRFTCFSELAGHSGLAAAIEVRAAQ